MKLFACTFFYKSVPHKHISILSAKMSVSQKDFSTQTEFWVQNVLRMLILR
jgi:hypothetical protein